MVSRQLVPKWLHYMHTVYTAVQPCSSGVSVIPHPLLMGSICMVTIWTNRASEGLGIPGSWSEHLVVMQLDSVWCLVLYTGVDVHSHIVSIAPMLHILYTYVWTSIACH